MAAQVHVPQFQPINQPAPGSMTNTGDRDDGNGGDEPPRGNKGPGGPQGGVSERERLLEAIMAALKEKLLKNPVVKTDKMTKRWAKDVLLGYEKFPNEFGSRKALKNGVNRQWMGQLSSEEVTNSTRTVDGRDVDFNGGANYLPTILASSQRNAESHGGHDIPQRPDNRCGKCKRISDHKFTACITLPGAFRGACLECAYGNHYEDCDFSDHMVTPRQPASQGTPSRRMRGLSINPAPAGRFGSQPPSPSVSDEGQGQRNELPGRDDRQRVDWARSFMVPSAGSRRGQAVINFNYSAGSEREEAMAEMHAALRRVADAFEEYLRRHSGPYDPNKYQPPRFGGA